MMNDGLEIKRNPALDIIRCVAFALVISVHFALNSGFYDLPVKGGRMYVMTLIRTGSMICVPLFLVLTGYLMCNKHLNRSFYFKGIKTIIIYVMASITCIVFRNYYLEEGVSFLSAVKGLFDFSDAPYSWYIEMYIGLFVFIPFLNVMYNNLKSKKQKQCLLLTLLFLTSLSGIINIYNLNSLKWWCQPGLSSEYYQLIPEWWTEIYPLTYYFFGAYIREYGFNIKKSINLILLIMSVVIFGTFNYWRSYSVCFVWGEWQSWGSMFNVIMTILVFVLLLHVDWMRLPMSVKRVINTLSDCCLGAYLVSWIFDKIFYGKLIEVVPDIVKRMDYYIMIVPVIIVCSLVLSYMLSMLYKLLCKIKKVFCQLSLQ